MEGNKKEEENGVSFFFSPVKIKKPSRSAKQVLGHLSTAPSEGGDGG